MSVSYDQNKKYSDYEIIEDLKLYLKKSFLKKDKASFNSSSAAITKNNIYYGGLIESNTNLLSITSEQASLSISVSCKDPNVNKIITVVDGEFIINLLVIKIIIDHIRRTGVNITYEIYDIDGNKLYECNNLSEYYNYRPKTEVMEKINNWKPIENGIEINSSEDIEEQLKKFAIKGMETHFSSDSKSLYGASLLAGNKIYFGGVYSSFEKRLNIHSEMLVTLLSIMDNNLEISKICLISNKFVDDIPHMCGCCRQFFSEVQSKINRKIEFISFSLDNSKKFKIMIDDYLPNIWNPHKK